MWLMSELILVLQQKTRFSLHSFEWFEEEKATLGVTKKNLVASDVRNEV